MNRTPPSLHPAARAGTVVLGLLLLAMLSWTAYLGVRSRKEPAGCPTGFTPSGPRCCAPGQGQSRGACVGKPDACAPPTVYVSGSEPGCVTPNRRVPVAAGKVLIGPTDWDGPTTSEARSIAVRAFFLDRVEVTVYRYRRCLEAGACDQLALASEPGVPVTNVSLEQAARFCTFEGGRLPTPEEWTFAATGPEGRRYPWGAHGLVCRRAAFGLVTGPCREEATGPELAGLRPDGATPSELLDLSGNVAEWSADVHGLGAVHGGSFASTGASELKSWSVRKGKPGPDVGFRCAYDAIAPGAIVTE